MITLFKKTLNPLCKRTYGKKNQYKRELKIALICWFEWEIKPLFTGEIYRIKNSKFTRYSDRLFFLKRLLD